MVLPDNFKKRLAERKVIPFVGAGASMNVKGKDGDNLFPSWKKLLENSVEALRNSGEESFANLVDDFIHTKNDYLSAAKYAREGLKNNWNDFLNRQFNPNRANVEDSSLEIGKLVWQLGSSLIITTNYDKVLKWTNENVEIWNIESKFSQGKLLSEGLPNEPTVWHLHGYIGNPSDIILTPDGYQKLYPNDEAKTEAKYKTAITTLRSLLTSYTFLFIGFSLNDENFVNQIRKIDDLFDGSTGEHFVLVKETEKDTINNLNLPVKPIPYENHGEPLLARLREMIATVPSQKKLVEAHKEERELTATERFNPKNRVVHIPFNQKGDQVVGREKDLEAVHKTLAQGLPTNIGQAVSFQGLGGLGKTQLAVEYAYKFESEYPNGVIWLTVDQDIDKQLVEVCDKAEWVSPLSEIKVKLDVARNRLKTITDCLIVLDNVETFDERIKEYLPAPQKSIHILATSRYEIVGFNPVKLELLTVEQSVQMLEQESRGEIKDETERATVGQIAGELGNLPLALELAGGFLRYRPIGWENYLSLLKQNPREAFKEKFLAGSFTNHDKDVYRTLKVSENILNEEPLLREVLDLLTWSGTSAMGVDLMSRLLGKNEIELLKVLSLGNSLNLLQKSPERNAYAIHRLVGEVRKEDIPLAERADWINNICQLLGDWFQEIRTDFTKLPEYEAELEHLVTWQEHARELSPENASRLLWLQGYPPYYRGEYKSAKSITSKALELYRQEKNENQITLAHLYNDFGNVSGDLGKYQEQFDYTKKALDIRLELLGESHPDTAISFNNVGSAYGKLRKYQEQFDSLKKALDIQLKLLGESHPDTATSFNNVGLAYGELKKYQEQFNNLKKALDIRLELFGENHPNTANSFNNVGIAYGKLRKYQEEFDNFKKALDIRLELFGENHPDTAISFFNLSFHYQKLKDYKTATEYADKSFLFRREILGNFHPSTLESAIHLSTIYTENKNGDQALKLINDFLRIVPKTNSKYKKLENRKRWILQQTKREGFRQQSINPSKKKGKKKRR